MKKTGYATLYINENQDDIKMTLKRQVFHIKYPQSFC